VLWLRRLRCIHDRNVTLHYDNVLRLQRLHRVHDRVVHAVPNIVTMSVQCVQYYAVSNIITMSVQHVRYILYPKVSYKHLDVECHVMPYVYDVYINVWTSSVIRESYRTVDVECHVMLYVYNVYTNVWTPNVMLRYIDVVWPTPYVVYINVWTSDVILCYIDVMWPIPYVYNVYIKCDRRLDVGCHVMLYRCNITRRVYNASIYYITTMCWSYTSVISCYINR